MKATIYFEKPLGILHDVYAVVSSEHAEVEDIETNESGVSIEAKDGLYYFVPWHNVKCATVSPDA